MRRIGWESRPSYRRGAVALLAVGCAALAAMLSTGRGAAGEPGTGRRAAHAEVMIITRGALEGGLSPSG
jgi:hypothetical protein